MPVKFIPKPAAVVFLLCFVFVTCRLCAQENKDGKIVKNVLTMQSGARFVIGDKIHLGDGSDASNAFKFIYISPLAFAGAGQKLTGNFAGQNLVLKKFEFWGSKKKSKKIFLVLGGAGFGNNYWCDVVAAIKEKEVIVKGINDGSGKDGAALAAGPSLADELKKLKDLHDAKALTDKEYEAAKKKLLGN